MGLGWVLFPLVAGASWGLKAFYSIPDNVMVFPAPRLLQPHFSTWLPQVWAIL